MKIKRIAILFGILITLFLGSYATTLWNPALSTELVRKGTVIRSIESFGTISDTADIALSFDTTRVVQSISVKKGQAVKKGEVLVTIKNSAEQSAYKKAQVAYTKAQDTYKKISTTEKKSDDYAQALDDALAELVTTQAMLDIAQTALERTAIKAPVDGTVVAIPARKGYRMQAFESAVVVQATGKYISIETTTKNNRQILVGQNSFFVSEKGTYKGTVRSVAVSGESAKVVVAVEDGAAVGIEGMLRIVTNSVNNALYISTEAIRIDNGASTVDVIRDFRRSTIRPRIITTGLRGDAKTEVLEGLGEGERIVWSE